MFNDVNSSNPHARQSVLAAIAGFYCQVPHFRIPDVLSRSRVHKANILQASSIGDVFKEKFIIFNISTKSKMAADSIFKIDKVL